MIGDVAAKDKKFPKGKRARLHSHWIRGRKDDGLPQREHTDCDANRMRDLPYRCEHSEAAWGAEIENQATQTISCYRFFERKDRVTPFPVEAGRQPLSPLC